MRKSNLPWLSLSVFIFIADQLTKLAALRYLEPYQPKILLPLLNFTLAFNRGSAFSFLHNAGGWQVNFFIGITLLVSVVLLIWMWRLPKGEQLAAVSLALILGGAVGNLVDRLRLGFVIDFIELHLHDWYWPAFNIADAAITMGALLLMFSVFKNNKKS